MLAPTGHEVEPVSVLSAVPLGGAVQGDPRSALGGDRKRSPLLTGVYLGLSSLWAGHSASFVSGT